VDVNLSAVAGQPNLFVATTYDPSAQLESALTAVPPITVQAAPSAPTPPTVTSPTGPVTLSQSTTLYTIMGKSTPNLLAEVWRAASGSSAAAPAKDPTATGPVVTQRVGSDSTFGMDVPLAATAGQPNLFVVTTYDPTGHTESNPVAVPPITVQAVSGVTPPAPPTVTDPASPQTLASGTTRYAIRGRSTAGLLIRVWPSAPGAPTIKDPSATAPSATAITAGDGSYSAEVNLVGGRANLFVVTAYDLVAQLESTPVGVPAITLQSAVPPPAAPAITDPAAPIQLPAGSNRYAIKGVGTANLQTWIWLAASNSSPTNPTKDPTVTGPSATSVIGNDGRFSVEVNLPAPAGYANLFVATVWDTQNRVESAPAYVPAITVQQSSGTVTVPSVPTAGPVTPPGPATGSTSSGTTSPPAIPSPTVTKPVPGSQVSVPVGVMTYAIEGSLPNAGPQGTLVQVFRTDASGQISVGATMAGSVELLPGDTTFRINVFLDPAGANYFAVNAKDNATGALSAASSLISILPPPAAPTLKDLAATEADETTDYEMSGTSQPKTMVQVFPAANGAKQQKAAALASDTLFGDQMSFSLKFSLPTEDPPSQLALTAKDASGNESSPTIVPVMTPAAPPKQLEAPSTRLIYTVFDDLEDVDARRTKEGVFFLDDVNDLLKAYNRATLSGQEMRKHYQKWQTRLVERQQLDQG
jgi:hypothetical protein